MSTECEDLGVGQGRGQMSIKRMEIRTRKQKRGESGAMCKMR